MYVWLPTHKLFRYRATESRRVLRSGALVSFISITSNINEFFFTVAIHIIIMIALQDDLKANEMIEHSNVALIDT